MSSEGAANAISFGNTALKPGFLELDKNVINAVYEPFCIKMTDNEGKLHWQTIMFGIALDNAVGPDNPEGMIVFDYTDAYLPRLSEQVKIKPDPELPQPDVSGFPAGSPPPVVQPE